MNFLRAHPQVQDGVATLVAEGFTLPLPAHYQAADLPPNLTLGLRPEHLYLKTSDPLLRGTVRLVETLGSETLVLCQTPAGAINLRVSADQTISIGEGIGLDIQSEWLHLFDESTGQRVIARSLKS
ncbi:TOBE domain-containing protein [Anthocerotibacter panamensis]|uniref:TOBE domain-containing protein n=1 Tax=Anthocerotibacter panamensis TaxID=2857077 RepID=UPI0036F23F64